MLLNTAIITQYTYHLRVDTRYNRRNEEVIELHKNNRFKTAKNAGLLNTSRYEFAEDMENNIRLERIKTDPGLALGLDDNLRVSQNPLDETTLTDIDSDF